ncbi:sulfotransferase domain, partial [Haematococcus lacustris]
MAIVTELGKPGLYHSLWLHTLLHTFLILYKELLVEFPEAKVLLTVRDFDSWYTSVL